MAEICAATAPDHRKGEQMSKKLTALYARLSREDGDKMESCSIETQKRILTEFADKNGLTPYRIWVDDGASGKDFNRPGFQAMYSEIEKGNISAVVVKELDRFSRNYLESGLYREEFRKAGVRFISLAENLDSASGNFDDFTPFREVINEFYLSQYSKKIKAAFRSRGMAGKHTSSYCPYGYYKSPDDKKHFNELHDFGKAEQYLRGVLRERFDPKKLPPITAWQRELDELLAEKQQILTGYNALNERVKSAETIRRYAEQVMREDDSRARPLLRSVKER